LGFGIAESGKKGLARRCKARQVRRKYFPLRATSLYGWLDFGFVNLDKEKGLWG
jgi:hypothetical protein